jgi:transcription initiation factor IIE alpha subunit
MNYDDDDDDDDDDYYYYYYVKLRLLLQWCLLKQNIFT